MAESQYVSNLQRKFALLGMWDTFVKHFFGGLTQQSTEDGNRICGDKWFLVAPKLRTVTSQLVEILVEALRITGMSIPLILGESAMHKPEMVDLLRSRGVIELTKRGT